MQITFLTRSELPFLLAIVLGNNVDCWLTLLAATDGSSGT